MFIFAHIPKTGGTSLTKYLCQLFGDDRCYVQNNPGDYSVLEKLSAMQKSGTMLVSGHFDLPQVFLAVEGMTNVNVITSIRDPLDLMISTMHHDLLFSEKGTMTIVPFIVRKIIKRFTQYIYADYLLNTLTRFFSGKRSGRLTTKDYRAAMRMARRVDFIFDLDNLNDSISKFRSTFAIQDFHSFDHLNSNLNSRRKIRQRWRYFSRGYRAINYDLHLYHALKQIRTQNIEIGQNEPSRFIYVSEVVRRTQYRVRAADGYFRFENNDIYLHPPVIGEHSLISRGIGLYLYVEYLACTLKLDYRSHWPVQFQFAIRTNDEEWVHSVVVYPGEEKYVKVEIGRMIEVTTIELSTQMSEQAESADFASAFFIGMCMLVRELAPT